MSLLNRITGYVKSNLNDLLNRAENPEIMLEQLIIDMKSSFNRARDEVKQAIMEQKRFESEAEINRNKALEWDEKALGALELEKVDLAKKCLKKKRNFEKLAESLESSAKTQQEDVEAMKKELMALKAKLEEAKEKKMIIVAAGAVRKQKARRSKKGEARLNVDLSAFERFERMEEKINLSEFEVEAVEALDPDIFNENDEFDKELKALEDNEIENALRELRKKAGPAIVVEDKKKKRNPTKKNEKKRTPAKKKVTKNNKL